MKPCAVLPEALLATGHAPAATDGDDLVRARLLRAGLALFSAQGFAKTSIRQIATAAHANVAAVSYYFGDKAGLYRALLRGSPDPARAATGCQITSLDDFYARFLEPLKHGEAVRLWVKLYRREMLEPTGLWQEKIDHDMRPMHAALVALLCERLGLAQADDEVHRLAITLAGLAVHLFIGCDVIDALAPQLCTGPADVDAWRARLVQYAQALISAERVRRRAAARRIAPKAGAVAAATEVRKRATKAARATAHDTARDTARAAPRTRAAAPTGRSTGARSAARKPTGTST